MELPLSTFVTLIPQLLMFIKRSQFKNTVRIPILFHYGGCYHIETSPLIYSANQLTGFYMITASIMKDLKEQDLLMQELSFIESPNRVIKIGTNKPFQKFYLAFAKNSPKRCPLLQNYFILTIFAYFSFLFIKMYVVLSETVIWHLAL